MYSQIDYLILDTGCEGEVYERSFYADIIESTL
jgi:hypothetical protein